MADWIDVHGTPLSVAARYPHPYTVDTQPKRARSRRHRIVKPQPSRQKAIKRAYHGFCRLLSAPTKTGCLEWLGMRKPSGYGVIFVGRYRMAAHRYSYQYTHQVTLQPDQFVCHKCDNPSCVNPDHLFIGSAKDNVADMIAKGRAAWQRKKAPLPESPAPVPGLPRLVKARAS